MHWNVYSVTKHVSVLLFMFAIYVDTLHAYWSIRIYTSFGLDYTIDVYVSNNILVFPPNWFLIRSYLVVVISTLFVEQEDCGKLNWIYEYFIFSFNIMFYFIHYSSLKFIYDSIFDSKHTAAIIHIWINFILSKFMY